MSVHIPPSLPEWIPIPIVLPVDNTGDPPSDNDPEMPPPEGWPNIAFGD